jgi:hypothetical protein
VAVHNHYDEIRVYDRRTRPDVIESRKANGPRSGVSKSFERASLQVVQRCTGRTRTEYHERTHHLFVKSLERTGSCEPARVEDAIDGCDRLDARPAVPRTTKRDTADVSAGVVEMEDQRQVRRDR